MNIIYIAYSCAPNNGTEDKLGWYIPYEVSKRNNVWVITKSQGKKAIENFQKDNDSNVHVVYCDVSNTIKKIYRGAFYSGRMNYWNRKAEIECHKICLENNIDIIHQINPVEFRSIGNYGQFGVPFVCGPVGGGEYLPREVVGYAHNGLDKEIIRAVANSFYKWKYLLQGRLKGIDKLIFANEETKRYLISQKSQNNYLVMTEIGTLSPKNNLIVKPMELNAQTHFLAAGRLIYRKGFSLLLDSIEEIPCEYNLSCSIVGDGPLYSKLKSRIKNSKILSKRVEMVGKVPYEQMGKYYSAADYLVMPSLRETTGSVILEAMENGIPVITVNKFGAKNLLDANNSIVYSYDELSPKEALKEALIEAIEKKGSFDKEVIKTKAGDFSFENRADFFEKMYVDILKRNKVF